MVTPPSGLRVFARSLQPQCVATFQGMPAPGCKPWKTPLKHNLHNQHKAKSAPLNIVC
jgi:hypothetical protein